VSDIADRYSRLADGFLARVRATPDALWDAPSPCRGWTARDVVAHVVNGHRGIVAVARGTRPAAADCVGLSAMGDAPAVDPGADLAAAFTRCRDDLLTVLRDPVLASRPLPFGPLGPVSVEQAVDVVGALELLATPGTWLAPPVATRCWTPRPSPAPTEDCRPTPPRSRSPGRSTAVCRRRTAPTHRPRSCASPGAAPSSRAA
jgi:hypothetical protein